MADDLGVGASSDPVRAILEQCQQRILGFLGDYPDCPTLTELLSLAANKLGATFEEVHSDEQLNAVRERYLHKGERGFADLQSELSEDVFGITLRRIARKEWEPPFVSVIDCRGDKRHRSYFTKWHELGHLLILTDQMRLSFCRTHARVDEKDPEEQLVDLIAGAAGFLPQIVKPIAKGNPSFERLEEMRKELCPEASRQASALGFVRAWPTPCLLLRAELGVQRDGRIASGQGRFGFHSGPEPVLRAVKVTTSNIGRRSALRIFWNMRVPERSVIHRVFSSGLPAPPQIENLSWWTSSDGRQLPEMSVVVHARGAYGGVDALVAPY